ncbi:MAG: hypothetical protein ACXVGN_00230 [Mycobacteriaceae bacterium]
MSWEMVLNDGKDSQLVERVFENFEDGVDWLRQNAPQILNSPWASLDGSDWRQFGTNDRWASFRRAS